MVLFVVANFAYQSALIYYDSTLKTVSKPETRGRLSGIGVGVGYCGTIFAGLFLLALGVRGRGSVLRRGGPVRGVRHPDLPVRARVRADRARLRRRRPGSLTQLRTSIAHAREVPGLLRFLVGRFFYSDAVNTIIVVMTS